MAGTPRDCKIRIMYCHIINVAGGVGWNSPINRSSSSGFTMTQYRTGLLSRYSHFIEHGQNSRSM